jgi:hypothetical protein
MVMFIGPPGLASAHERVANRNHSGVECIEAAKVRVARRHGLFAASPFALVCSHPFTSLFFPMATSTPHVVSLSANAVFFLTPLLRFSST